ncbi:MAG TPA: hypothetical protein VE631_10675 [Alphaproteobacteria bacterium]|nr:hypothetical protein [Alphaproteobacteria bacterium]
MALTPAPSVSASRAQVRNLLDAAADMGLLAVEGRGGHTVRLEPDFVDLSERWIASDLAWMRFLALAALAESGRASGAA